VRPLNRRLPRSPSTNRTYTFRYVSGSPEITAKLSSSAESVFLHDEDRTYRSLLCVHRVFPRLRTTSISCPPSPCGRLSRPQTTLRGLRPASVLPWSPQIACTTGRRNTVPMFPFSTPGWLGFCFTPGGPGEKDKRNNLLPDTGLIVPSR
jgi:hypothetical protein